MIVTTGAVDNAWSGILSASELQALHTFEAQFKVRQVVWYTFPNDFGLTFTGQTVNTVLPAKALTVALTAAGKTIFPYINTGAQSRPLLVDSVTLGGASLEDLWFRTDALKRIWQSHWDYVIIQERGGRAAMDLGERFHTYLGMFASAARMSGAKPVLFMTWYPGNEDFFRAAARRANTLLLPVGLHWEKEFDLDGTHPNVAGSHLIACSVYSMIYKKPCGEESSK